MRPARVFVCDCQPIMVEGLRKVLEPSPDLEVIGAALTLEEALAGLADLAPDLVLVSEEFGAPLDAPAIAALRNSAPEARLVLWSSTPNSHEAYLELGFSGILDKTSPVEALVECLRAVAQGSVWVDGHEEAPEPLKRRNPPRLTRRERDIVGLVAQGMKNREIAEALAISPGTVKVHLMHIFEKAGVEDRLQLALLARRLLSQDPSAPSRPELEEAERTPV